MNNEFPFSTKQLLEGLPRERSAPEIAGKYRAVISDCVNEYAKSRASTAWNKMPALTISLAKDVASKFGRILEWSEELIPDFDVQAAMLRPLYSTRDIASQKPSVPTGTESYSFERIGVGCSAKIVLVVRDSILDMTVSLLDVGGSLLLPFHLSIVDKESNQTLMAKKEFQTGAARIKGVERGEYGIVCEHGSRVCEFSITVR